MEGGGAQRRVVRALVATQCGLLLAYLGLLALDQAAGTLRDMVLGNLVLTLPVLLVALRAWQVRDDRRWATPLALGMGSFLLGNLYYLSAVAPLGEHAPFPTLADAGYLGLYPFTVAAVALSLRGQRLGRRSVLLDGLIGSLGAATVTSALVAPFFPAWGSELAGVVSAAYPVADVVVLAMVVGLFGLKGGHPGRFYAWLGAGLATFVVADTIYATRLHDGTYVVGTPLDGLWALGLTIVGFGVWVERGRVAPARPESVASLIVPLGSIVLALVVLLRASRVETALTVVVFAGATLLAALARTADAFVGLRNLARAKREARTDELTGLANRRLLYERVEEALTAGPPDRLVSLVLVDLDRFKEVNDSLGHQVGDELLRAVGSRLARAVRPGEVIARLGGDEFAVLVPGDGGTVEAAATAERLQDGLVGPFDLQELTVHVQASMGVAAVRAGRDSRSDLLRQADVAMYTAKRAGGGIAAYEAARDTHSRERLRVVAELRQAMLDDQIVVHYQPKCRLDGQIIGAEALVRWAHPRRGLLAPDAFLDVAEENGLTPALTRVVLRRAAGDARFWRTRGLHASVSVNLSPSTLLDPQLVPFVQQVLEESRLEPDALWFEITETTVMTDPVRGRAVLNALRGLGVRLSVDDYGTGHCSLAYLRHLPVDELKLDRSFLGNIADDKRDAAIVRSTVELAHALGMVMVAEGVESATCAEVLARMGCDLAQGFYFCPPVPLTQLLGWVAGSSAMPRETAAALPR